MVFYVWVLFHLVCHLNSTSIHTDSALSPKINITGHWEGTLTRDDGGGKRATFPMELDILHRRKEVAGVSYAGYENEDKKYYAKFEIVGKMNGTYFKFEESKILNADSIPHAEWCIKKGELIYRKPKDIETLEGVWEGVSTNKKEGCNPGRIFLQKKPSRV
jgi:hypothetical protein